MRVTIKTKVVVCLLCTLLVTTPALPATPPPALPILGLIKAAVKKAIKAIDLRIQKLQNKTIWLQNAQKKLENTLSKTKLKEISDWTQKQKDLYNNYYEELMRVKSIITYYQRVRDISDKQVRLLQEYEHAWSLLREDPHFNPQEIAYMQQVYSGLLGATMENIDRIFLILDSFTTRMSDAKRLELINAAADAVDTNYDDLLLFNRQNMLVSLQRAKTLQEVDRIRSYYGIK